jgi:hypothetical protein
MNIKKYRASNLISKFACMTESDGLNVLEVEDGPLTECEIEVLRSEYKKDAPWFKKAAVLLAVDLFQIQSLRSLAICAFCETADAEPLSGDTAVRMYATNCIVGFGTISKYEYDQLCSSGIDDVLGHNIQEAIKSGVLRVR